MNENTRYVMGIKKGSINKICGLSGAGATTMALQTANIIATSENQLGEIIHFDLELGTNRKRVKSLGISEEIYSHIITIESCNMDTLLDIIIDDVGKIKLKTKNKKPTVIIVDSFKMLGNDDGL